MKDWGQFFARRLSSISSDDYLKQVGHTVNGQAISESAVKQLLDQIISSLELGQDEVLLDICCGNGLFTRQLADHVKHVVAIDACAPLIEIAKQVHSHHNVDYFCHNALDLSPLLQQINAPYSRILIFAALQHFTAKNLKIILSSLELKGRSVRLYLGFVPDQELRRNFYNTKYRRMARFVRVCIGRDNFGKWWNRQQLLSICNEFGLTCEFVGLPPGSYGANYRFNAIAYN